MEAELEVKVPKSRSSLEVVLSKFSVYLCISSRMRIIYFTTMVISLSLLRIDLDIQHIEILTGKKAFLNQVFVKMGWAWTIGSILVLRLSCLPNEKSKKQFMFKLLFRTLASTFFFHIWCQIIFPSLEEVTGVCIKQGIRVDLSKRKCMKREDHFYEAFDISGHAYLLTYCILHIMSEVKAVFYGFGIKKVPQHKSKSSAYVESFSHSMVLIFFASIFMFLLCIIWDVMLIITTMYYHTVIEKFLGMFLGVSMWFLLYKLIFKAFDFC